jgi:hypothetical protein
VKRLTLISIVALVLAATGALAADARSATAPKAASADVVNLVPSRIVGFNWIRGQAAWRPGSYSRIGRSVFQFGAGGRFALFQPDGYPTLRGSFRISGDTARFTARYAFVTITGNNTTEVQGTLNVRTGRTQILYVAGMTLAAYVNEEHFGLSNVKVFQAQLQLRSM